MAKFRVVILKKEYPERKVSLEQGEGCVKILIDNEWVADITDEGRFEVYEDILEMLMFKVELS